MSDLARVDFTYWPETGRVEWHGHADLEGDGELLAPPVADVKAALAAFEAEMQRRVKAAQWFAQRRTSCADFHPRRRG